MLAVASPHHRLLYAMALVSGARANEISQITGDHLDLKNRGVRLAGDWTKGRRDCLQPLPGWFLEYLRAYGGRKIAADLYGRSGRAQTDVPANPLFFVPQHPCRTVYSNLKRAGIEKVTPQGKVDFHALRTTFATLLDELGASERTKEVLLRHQPLSLAHQRYVVVRQERLAELVDKLSELLGLKDLYAGSMP